MKLVLSYLKNNAKWFLSMLLIGAMMCAVMLLNNIPLWESAYGLLLCGVVILFVIIIDCVRYARQLKQIRELKNTITFSMEKLPKPDSAMEMEYQKLLEQLFEEKVKNQNESENKAKNLNEYYTMWVHQIKTPIAALKLLLQEKSEEINTSEEIDELFRVEQYVEMALQYTRLDSESNDFVFQRLELDEVIRGAVRKYARLFIRKKIKLNFTETNIKVLSDEKWLGFVIEQLLSNAIKYTQSGEIRIYGENQRIDGIEHDILVIEDTGMGIQAEDLPRVFEKGYTGYNGHADKRSTGIGLYICHRMLEKLSHEIAIQSEEGVGTKVKIYFKQQ